ncbi:molybdate ABC transporter substrate-binding protein [Frankia sp. AgB1.9]|uniref:molybdate ABC transporter substrate-binding protein n=1 Tax=unclassified Frankia TaxID=2632575 RepID=UPI0019323C68|nr:MULTISPECIES: molybdate ABC transporter substrate-binding protein [unclassified Frankia]MBL7489610.1 molybdate ABC transporter substrate-binding protein [Frankia sp. AgW1.1]MBL7547317.1 molybdate ABC transporter substrate-binding protein [Frankia sp. AgB1.9]MBL7618716.1 molybdate ABC transporter substrate-binding protein [Frankia sp. AgB1.8]
MRIPRPAAAAVAGVVTVVVLAGCGSSSGGAAGTPSASSTPALSGTITVLAASSLTGTFTDLGKSFEAAHPGVTVKFSFGASSTLATQINSGAPADVFASASTKNMTQVTDQHNAANPTTFATNEAEIAVPPSNPQHIATIEDLAKPGVKVALCQAAVPCGVVAHSAFDKAKITVKPVTEGPDVKSVLTTVELGEVDAGVVYKTDVLAAGSKVLGVEIPENENASTAYPIAALTASKNKAVADAFVAYVLSATGRTVLTKAGFAQP